MEKHTRFGMTAAACMFALLIPASSAIAGNQPSVPAAADAPALPSLAPAEPEKLPALPATITYVNGQLKIAALDSSVGAILAKVAEVTGVKIDVPPAANNQRLAMIQLGPGPAREVLASLLTDSNVDYMIQASDTEPDKIQMVLVIMRDKKGAKAEVADAAMARRSRSPYARGAASSSEPEEAAVPEPAAQPETAAIADPAAADQPAAPSAEQPPTPPSTTPVQPQPGQLNGVRIAPQPLPAALDSQNISQQLQQMYQQRVQINQQDRAAQSGK